MSLDDDCSARRPYRCAWRARSRRPHTHATCERRVDAKASSGEAMVDVEVDRCIDENSAECRVGMFYYLAMIDSKYDFVSELMKKHR